VPDSALDIGGKDKDDQSHNQTPVDLFHTMVHKAGHPVKRRWDGLDDIPHHINGNQDEADLKNEENVLNNKCVVFTEWEEQLIDKDGREHAKNNKEGRDVDDISHLDKTELKIRNHFGNIVEYNNA
jgi:hypothetical protein